MTSRSASSGGARAPAVIDWWRVAEPQADGYDSRVALELVGETSRRPGSSGSGASLFGGRVRLRDGPGGWFPDRRPAPHDHPNVLRADDVLRCWPEGFAQAGLLVTEVNAYVAEPPVPDGVVGSTSGAGSGGFGSVAATVDHHVGFVEAIVHEMGHHKLRALGVEFESATRLVRNDPRERHPSPIRYDRLRPMSAVLHALYSYTYVAALDVAIVRAGLDAERDRVIARSALAVILPKLEFGLGVVDARLEPDDAGRAFMAGLRSWLERVLAAGHEILRDFGIAPVEFVHPLRDGENDPGEPPVDPAPTIRGPFPRRRSTVVEEHIDDEALLYVADEEIVVSLNRSAAAIWQLCDGTRDSRAITQELLEGFAGASDVREQVIETLDRFRSLRLLEG